MLFKLLGMKSIYKETLKVSSSGSSSESSQSVKLLVSKSTGQGSGSDETCDDPTADVMKLMQERLPSYVVNCFVASGYNSKAICCMSVSDVPNNSIQEIEDFVEKHCDTDAASFCNQKTLCQPKPFIFFHLGIEFKLKDLFVKFKRNTKMLVRTNWVRSIFYKLLV